MPCCSLPAAGDALLRQKLGLLNFSFAAGWDPTEMLPVYLAAACDPSEQVEDAFSLGFCFKAWPGFVLCTAGVECCGAMHASLVCDVCTAYVAHRRLLCLPCPALLCRCPAAGTSC